MLVMIKSESLLWLHEEESLTADCTVDEMISDEGLDEE